MAREIHKEVAERFPREVANHQMSVVHAVGLHRHLTFMEPNTSNRHFHITTWPGYLCISGDMGCYVFARLPDMFEFFRGGKGINPGYWSEKLQADEKHGGHYRPDRDRYVEHLRDDFKQWEFENSEQRAAVWDDVMEELGSLMDDGNLRDAIDGAHDYRPPFGEGRFVDFWDHDFNEYTFHFLWCCHAIKYAIEQYDQANALAKVA